MSKDLFADHEGMLTARDDEILLDLYLLDWATTDQLWPLHFPANVRKRAYNRLCDLCTKKGVLTRRVVPLDIGHDAAGHRTTKVAFWALSVAARNVVRGRLEHRGLPITRLFAEVPDGGRFARTNPEYAGLRPFETRNAWHLKAITDVYVGIKGALLRDLGEVGEGWTWRNERRANIPYGDTQEHSYRPDAELVLHFPQGHAGGAPGSFSPGQQIGIPRSFHLYFEVQTARSKRSASEIARRIAGHAVASRLKHFPENDVRALVFIGESASHVRAAGDAARDLGIPAICGTAAEVLPVVKQAAASVSRGASPSLQLRSADTDTEPATPSKRGAQPSALPGAQPSDEVNREIPQEVVPEPDRSRGRTAPAFSTPAPMR